MKTITAAKLQSIFETASVTLELPIGDRFADVCAQFPQPIYPFGKGIVIEVQYKNKGKDFGAVTREYFSHGYSLVWVYPEDFDGHDMTFPEEGVRKIWPHAVPWVDDWPGYQECVKTLLDPEDQPSVSGKQSILLPPEYWKAHQLELVSPSLNDLDGWQKIQNVEFHGKGDETAWFALHRSPNQRWLLEFWCKDHTTGEREWLPVWVSGEDATSVTKMQGEAEEALSHDDSYRSVDYWISIAHMKWTGGDQTDGWLSIAKAPKGRIKVIMGRQDQWGNRRTLAVNYRKGDIGRLSGLRDFLTRLS